MMRSFAAILISILALALHASAQFQFFEHMFGGGAGQGQPQDADSDSSWYMKHYDGMHCSKYLCPGTLSCVHFPHHCPCAFPDLEDKVELGDGIAICASKGGWKKDETIRKVELARKGLL